MATQQNPALSDSFFANAIQPVLAASDDKFVPEVIFDTLETKWTARKQGNRQRKRNERGFD